MLVMPPSCGGAAQWGNSYDASQIDMRQIRYLFAPKVLLKHLLPDPKPILI